MKVIKQFLAFAVAALFIVACNKSERFTASNQ